MYKVLIVDDERIVKLAIKSMIKWGDSGLEMAGTASNGISALEMVQKLKPDIIITDIKMPGMDGVMLIKKLKETGFDGEILVLSNHNDFELVREAMRYGAHDYVLKITAKSEDFSRLFGEMIAKIENRRGSSRNVKRNEENCDTVRENLFKQALVLEKENFSTEVNGLSKLYTMGSMDSIFTFVVCGDIGLTIQDSRQLPEVLRSIIEEFLAKSKWYTIIEIDKNTVFITALYQNADVGFSPEGLATRLIELIETYFNIKTGIVYSDSISDYNRLLELSRKGIRTSELLFYNEFTGRAIPINTVVSDNDSIFGDMYKNISEKVYNDFLKSDVETVLINFMLIVKQASENGISPYRLKKFIKKVLKEVERKLINNGYCSEELFDEYAGDEDAIYAAKTENKLLSCLRDLIGNAKTRISASRINYRKEVREALDFIEMHIRKKITLSDIARHVNLNDSYLCKVFKDDTGKSIVPYINERKMKIAYALLSKGDIMIKEASAAVGIDDQFYFNRLFKKIYGITPKDIKKRE